MSDYERPSTGRVVGWGTIILVGFLALLVVGSLAGLGWRYVIAGPKGAVGAKEIQQDAQNRVQHVATESCHFQGSEDVNRALGL